MVSGAAGVGVSVESVLIQTINASSSPSVSMASSWRK